MILIIVVLVVVVALVVIAKNSAVPASVKEERWRHKQEVRRQQRPLGFIFLGLFVILVALSYLWR